MLHAFVELLPIAQVYDFALPLLILHAFTFKTMDNLKHWLNICPRRQITVLDTHDGMGIDDIAGLAEVALPAHPRAHMYLRPSFPTRPCMLSEACIGEMHTWLPQLCMFLDPVAASHANRPPPLAGVSELADP